MVLYSLALLAIGIGVWMQIWAYRASSEREIPAIAMPQPPVIPATAPVVVPVTPPAPSVPSPAPVEPRPQIQPPKPVTSAPAVVVQPPPSLPKDIVISQALPTPIAGNGLRDATRLLPVPAGSFDNLDAVTSLGLTLPGGGNEMAFERDDLAGLFVVTPQTDNRRPAVILGCKSHAEPGGSVSILSIALDKAKSQLEFTWRTSIMLRQSRLVSLAYWVAQNSSLVLLDAQKLRPQRLSFNPVQLKPVNLSASSIDVASIPCDLPLPARLILDRPLPPGWQLTSSQENSAKGSSGPAVQVLVVEKVAKTALGTHLTIRFSPDTWATECDLVRNLAALREGLSRVEGELRLVQEEINRAKSAAQPDMDALNRRLADLAELKSGQAKGPAAGGATIQQIQAETKAVQQAIDARQVALDQLTSPLRARQQEQLEARRAYAAALAGYRELDAVNLKLVLEVPQVLRVANVRFLRDQE